MTRRSRSARAGIVSHDQHGAQHLLVTISHSGAYISIGDDVMLRLLTPSATIALIAALLDALRSHVPPTVGPLTGAM